MKSAELPETIIKAVMQVTFLFGKKYYCAHKQYRLEKMTMLPYRTVTKNSQTALKTNRKGNLGVFQYLRIIE